MKTKYSVPTSGPAYRDNPNGKRLQKEQLLGTIHQLGRATSLLELSQIVGLPQSTVAGRVNDLIKEELLMYDGHCEYENRKRNRIVLVPKEPTQGELFVMRQMGA